MPAFGENNVGAAVTPFEIDSRDVMKRGYSQFSLAHNIYKR